MNTETSKTTERDELLTQLEATNATIADMEAKIKQLKPANDWQPGSPHGVNNPKLGDLLRDVGDMQAKAEELQERLKQLDKVEAYREAVDRAIETAKETHQRLADLEHRITAIDKKAATVRQRINEMQNQAQKAEDEAKAAETEAIRAYAVAVSGGDAKAEKAAHAKVQETQAAVTAIQVQNAKNSSIIAALDAEATALEAQADSLKIERDELRKQLFFSIRTHLGARWDEAITDLMAIGASLMSADALAGRSSSELSRLHLPLFAAGAPSYQDVYSMKKQSHDISDIELLKVAGVI